MDSLYRLLFNQHPSTIVRLPSLSHRPKIDIDKVLRDIETAAITAGYLTIYYLSSGIGSSIGGGIWTNSVPDKLNRYLVNQTIAASAYANPIGFIAQYAPGTVERMAVARAQDETQVRLLPFLLLSNSRC